MPRRRQGNAIVEEMICTYETDSAIKVVQAGFEDKEIWIPKSQLAPHSEVAGSGDEGLLIIPRWLAKKHGLVE